MSSCNTPVHLRMCSLKEDLLIYCFGLCMCLVLGPPVVMVTTNKWFRELYSSTTSVAYMMMS